MPSTNSSSTAGLVLVAALLFLHPAANAQTTFHAVAAPVPDQIMAATRVFISSDELKPRLTMS